MSKFLGLAAAGLVALAASAASAATVSYTYNSGAAQAIPFTNTFSLPSFDTSTGNTLTAVTIDLTTTENVTSLVTNITDTARTYTNASSTITVSAAGPGGAFTSTSLKAGPTSGTAAPRFTTVAASNSGTQSSSVNDPNLAAYQTAGGQDLSLTFSAGDAANTGSGAPNALFFGGDGTASGSVTLTYTFDAFVPPPSPPTGVPEPISIALLGTSLLGLGLIRRRS